MGDSAEQGMGRIFIPRPPPRSMGRAVEGLALADLGGEVSRNTGPCANWGGRIELPFEQEQLSGAF